MTKNNKELKKILLGYSEEQVTKYNLEGKCEFEFIEDLSKKNGNCSFDKVISKAHIEVNLNRLISFKNGYLKSLFNTYCTIAHEVQHARALLMNNDEDKNYNDLLTLLEYGCYAGVLKIDRKKIGKYLLNIFRIQKNLDINYEFSTQEIHANLVGYKEAYNKFEFALSEEEKKTCKTIIKSLEFLSNQFQIFYLMGKTPVNKFSVCVSNSYKFIKENPEFLNKYPLLKEVFSENNYLVNPYQMYKKINSSVEPFYRKLMINWLISFEMDYKQFFEDEDFKKYVENIIKDYIDETIDYYRHKDMCKIFIRDERIINDNLRFKKKAVRELLNLARKYNLNINGGIILDSSLMTSTVNLVKTPDL